MFSVISNVSRFLCWFCLFVRQVSTSLLSERFVGTKTASRWTVGSYFQTGQRIRAVYIIFLICFVELAPTFTATPPDPWQYNLSAAFHSVSFRFSSSSPSRTILFKPGLNLDPTIPKSFYKGRVEENIDVTRAEITVFALQRSESGGYQIEVIDKTFVPATARMTVQVQCK